LLVPDAAAAAGGGNATALLLVVDTTSDFSGNLVDPGVLTNRRGGLGGDAGLLKDAAVVFGASWP